MKLCYVADGRSPFTKNWITYMAGAGHEIHLITSYPFDPGQLPIASLNTVPVAFSQLAGSSSTRNRRITGDNQRLRLIRKLRSGPLSKAIFNTRHWLGPLDVYRHTHKVKHIVDGIKPDLVHAMRIQFEGILASKALNTVDTPLVVSIWGNDLTLFARRFPLVGMMTKQTMSRADALLADCQRDLNLSETWGFDMKKCREMLPGGGGIQTDIFHIGDPSEPLRERLSIPKGTEVVVNPRGFRQYVRNDTFFQSIPLVLKEIPNVVFIGVDMEGNHMANAWVTKLGIAHAVRLMPFLCREEMADLVRLADVTASPSEHDGTPNSLLEGMACGTFPVAGDIEPIREWIRHGENGLLCDPGDPESLSRAIVKSLRDKRMRQRASNLNARLVLEHAEHRMVMARAERFYNKVVSEFKIASVQSS